MPLTLHHMTFVVRDLAASVPRSRAVLGEPVSWEELPQPGVRTARFALGDSWLVLVEPLSATGVPAEHLAKHSEGFLLMSLGVDDLESAVATLRQIGILPSGPARRGLVHFIGASSI